MAFSSISFLLYFLPLFFIIYYLIPARAKNVVLLAGSLFFYAWGEPRWILLLLASILVTWLLGRAMRPEAGAGRRRGLLILGLVFQLGLLVAVKYAGFFFGAFIDLPKLHLPLGVSFYTFHAISYLVDVYRQKTPPQKNLLRLGLYLALFPKLVMGPIVPYHELEPALAQRTIDAQDVSDGCFRFTIGLAKKALLRPVGSHNADPFYDEMEQRLLKRINDLGVGPQGLGGTTTALAVHIETAPTHIAGLPCGLNMSCHVLRHAEVTL